MTHAFRTRRLTVVVAMGTLTLAGISCARKYPPRNTQSDAVAFSRIEKAWVHTRGANVSVAVIDWQFDRTRRRRQISCLTSMCGRENGRSEAGTVRGW
jgi:hypothetical protein